VPLPSLSLSLAEWLGAVYASPQGWVDKIFAMGWGYGGGKICECRVRSHQACVDGGRVAHVCLCAYVRALLLHTADGTGVFKGKRAILSFTTGGPEMAYTADGFNGDMMCVVSRARV
jgi:putative NADPH-quinone reductase